MSQLRQFLSTMPLLALSVAASACGRPELTRDEARSQIVARLFEVSEGLSDTTDLAVGAILHEGEDVRHVSGADNQSRLATCRWSDEERWLCQLDPVDVAAIQQEVRSYRDIEEKLQQGAVKLKEGEQTLRELAEIYTMEPGSTSWDYAMEPVRPFKEWLAEMRVISSENAFGAPLVERVDSMAEVLAGLGDWE